MREEPLDITKDGPRLSGVLTLPEDKTWPMVVISHGYLSHKDGSKYLLLAQALAQAGIGTFRFDYRGCGGSEGEFSQSSPSARLKDLLRAIKASMGIPGFNGSLGIMGSSLGGYLAFIGAKMLGGVMGVALWSCLADLEGFCKRVGLPEEGFLPLEETTPGPGGLVIHGELDELIPLSQAISVYRALRPPKRLEIIAGADHRFQDKGHRLKAVGLTVNYFKRIFSLGG